MNPMQAFPTHNSLSLSEVNRRIQTVVENDTAAALHSQGSASSLTSPRQSFRTVAYPGCLAWWENIGGCMINFALECTYQFVWHSQGCCAVL